MIIYAFVRKKNFIIIIIITFVYLFFFCRTLQKAQETDFININCVDPLGRSALLMAIDNENLEMVELLIEHKVETKDALLHAISEEFVEAVEVLLDHEKTIHKPGEPHVSFNKGSLSLPLRLNIRFLKGQKVT